MADDPDEDVLRLAREIADAYRNGATPATSKRRPVRKRPTARRAGREDAVALGDVLGELVANQGWNDRLAASRVFTDWATIVGPEVAQHCHVQEFADGIVHLRTDSTAWAKEIKLLAPRLVAKLNEELGDGQVLRIDVKGPQAPSWKKGPRSIKGRGPRDTYG